MDPQQANLQPNLFLFNSYLRFNPTPTFLGVTFDHTLSFSTYISLLKAKSFTRLKALRCISGSSRGLSKEWLSLYIKLFFSLFLHIVLSGGFFSLALRTLPNWNAFTERLVTPSPAAFCFLLILLLLTEASLPSLRVTLTHFALSFYERAILLSHLINGPFASQPSFAFQVWPDLW